MLEQDYWTASRALSKKIVASLPVPSTVVDPPSSSPVHTRGKAYRHGGLEDITCVAQNTPCHVSDAVRCATGLDWFDWKEHDGRDTDVINLSREESGSLHAMNFDPSRALLPVGGDDDDDGGGFARTAWR